MFEKSKAAMKLIIVNTDEKSKQHCSFLVQLISQGNASQQSYNARNEDVEAVFLEKRNFENIQHTLSSSDYVLFVGNGKLASEQCANMEAIFDAYGMKFYKLGKRGVLCVERLPKPHENKKFAEFCKELDMPESITKRFTTNIISTSFFMTTTVGSLVSSIKMNDKIKEYQYSCLVYKFYNDYLERFMTK